MIFNLECLRRVFFLVLIPFLVLNIGVGQDYFQQEVNYDIDVKLDVENHFLYGHVTMEYINNAPDQLDKIYMHLWPNAYSAPNTAFAFDMVQRGNAAFHFAKEDEYGYIDSLDFKIDGLTVDLISSTMNPDMALLQLTKDLMPGDTIIIDTPFRVKIPKSFSRLGYTADAHQLTQWYPKPAVYDMHGWHQMPYLAVGEFYAEFGDYKVNITVPENQIVAATGTLQNKDERTWLLDLAKSDGVSSRSDSTFKTLHYHAEDVHDFAWFTNPKFKIDYASVALDQKSEIDLWVFYTDAQSSLWQDKALEYASKSTRFFSNTIGVYPYPSISIVNSPNQAGGGMEYPMITTIDRVADAYELDHVIAHEIGHFWFYGILGFNERLHPWMDEGLTTYYDHDYFFEQHGEDHFTSYIPGPIKKNVDRSLASVGYLAQACRHFDHGIDQPLSELSTENYVLGAYAKPAISFYYLEQYVGKPKLDAALKSFYSDWKFKHPYPKDLKDHLELSLDQNLEWFFDGLLMSDGYVDYSIRDFDMDAKMLSLQNDGTVKAPLKIKIIHDDVVSHELWIDGFEQDTMVSIAAKNIDKITIGAEYYDMDINPSNNHIKTKGVWKKSEGTDLGLWGGTDNLKANKSYLMPSIGLNTYDGLQLGLINYSAFLPARSWQDVWVANYGLRSKDFVGLYHLRFNKYFDKEYPAYLHGDIALKRYSYNYFDSFDQSVTYTRISPSISYHFKKGNNDPRSHSFSYRMHLMQEETPIFSNESIEIKNQWSNVHQLSYNFDRPHVLFPYEYEARFEYANYKNATFANHDYLKLDMTFKVDLQYKESKYFQFRFYGAKFITNSQRNSSTTNASLVKGTIPYSYQGFNDNFYEQFLIGRSEQEGLWSRQVILREGGFKTATTSSFNSVGQSNDYLFSMNLKSDVPFTLPFKWPLKAFFDVAQYNTKLATDRQFVTKTLYSLGFALEWGDGAFGLYLPVFNSSEIDIALDNRGSGLLSHWSFSLDLTKLNAWKAADKFGW